MLCKQTYTGIRPRVQIKHTLHHGDMVQTFGLNGCPHTGDDIIKERVSTKTALCKKCDFYTAQYIQQITFYYIHSGSKTALMMAVVMKATKLDQLFEREGGVSQVLKKNYVSAYTVPQHQDLGTGQLA